MPAQIAGLNVLRIINEPTAASLAYGLDKKHNETIMVFDLGGGTFDVSILDVGDGVFEVRSTAGDTHLGGDDFDKRVVDWLAEEFLRDQGIDLRKDRQALQRLTEAAEKAKIELSGALETTISLPFITADASGPRHLETKITRAKFEQLTADLVERCAGPVKQALADAKLTERDLDELILVGGSTRIPAVQALARRLAGGKEPNQSVNPDEVVAVGAAIQAGVLAGEVKGVVLLDVTPLSLGLETLGGVMTKLIERNTTIPARRSEVFSTAEDNQTAVDVHVLQGERELARDNRSLGHFRLEGIRPAPRGAAQVEVTFDIDANGILTVTAKDKDTGKEQKITISGSTQLSKDEIDRMVKDAQSHAEEDKRRREEIEVRNSAEAAAYQVERQIQELGDRVPSNEKARAEMLISQTRELIKNDSSDLSKLRQLASDLQQIASSISSAAYTQTARRQRARRARPRRTILRNRRSDRCGVQRSVAVMEATDHREVTSGEDRSADIDRLNAEIRREHEMYLRALADFDNYRRRVERERASADRAGKRDVILSLLEVLDSFEPPSRTYSRRLHPSRQEWKRSTASSWALSKNTG